MVTLVIKKKRQEYLELRWFEMQEHNLNLEVDTGKVDAIMEQTKILGTTVTCGAKDKLWNNWAFWDK